MKKKDDFDQDQHKKVARKSSRRIIMNVADCQYQVVRNVGKKLLGWKLQHHSDDKDWDVYWTDNIVEAQFFSRLEIHQKVNHFPGMSAISRKNNLAKNLMVMRQAFPVQYSFFPKTWLLPTDYTSLYQEFQSRQKGKAKTFIVKPQASCQGRGIFLTRNVLNDIQQSAHYVVQRYLHRPMLLDGLKFDLRIYVLLAGCDPLRIYIYKQGLTRLATVPYSPPRRQNLDNLCMHLTNYAINKQNPNFVFNVSETILDKGHKRTLSSTYQWLANQGVDVMKLKKDINMILIRTILSAQPQLAHNYRSCQHENIANNMCFQILGFDIMLDHNCKPYLLQVNYTPSFGTDTPLDKVIKQNLIHDSLILMNINQKNRNQIQKQKSKQVQARVYSGKRKKISPQQRATLAQQLQLQRDKYQDSHLGGFSKIYPLQGIDLSQQLTHAALIYQTKTSGKYATKGKHQSVIKLTPKPPKPPQRKIQFSKTVMSTTKIGQSFGIPLTNPKLLNNKSLRKGLNSQNKRVDSRQSLVASQGGQEQRHRKKKSRQSNSLAK